MLIGSRELTVGQLMAALRRRMWWIIIPPVLCTIAAFVIALKVPPRYTSQALVLVEPPRVPDRFVTPIVNEQMNSRLATIREQILSRSRLQPIIERFGLYHEDVGEIPIEELVDRMRKAIDISAIRTEAGPAGSSGFRIAFTWKDPAVAQQVCKEIMSIFMAENLKIREQRAEDTTDFLSKQLDDAKRKLDEQDAKLAEFKRRHIGQLPTDENRNIQMLATLTNRLEALNQSVAQARQQRMLQESLLSQQKTGAAPARTVNETERQIEALQTQLATLEGKYTPDHPDVIKLKQQINALRRSIQPGHQEAAAAAPEAESAAAAQGRIALRVLDDDIRSKVEEQTRLQREIDRYESNIYLTPSVEEGSKALTRDYQTASEFYSDLLTKKTQSEMATDLERRQQGEQFRVMDSPNLPEKPVFPKKKIFLGGGFMFGLFLGLGLSVLLEIRENVIRDERDITTLLQLPVLAVICEFDGEVDADLVQKHAGADAAHVSAGV